VKHDGRKNWCQDLLDVVVNDTPSVQKVNPGKKETEPIASFGLVHFNRNEGR
jgi:hypothetical protein